MDWLVNFQDISLLNLSTIKNDILKSNKIKLSDLKLIDLIYFKNKPILSGNGVYMFFDMNNCIYVGKCSSRSFIERIPDHLDMREIKGWGFASCARLLQDNKKVRDHKEAVNYLLNCYSFLINFTNIHDLPKYCYKLEKIFRYIFSPLNELSNNIRKTLEAKIVLSNTLLENLSII